MYLKQFSLEDDPGDDEKEKLLSADDDKEELLTADDDKEELLTADDGSAVAVDGGKGYRSNGESIGCNNSGNRIIH